MVRSGRAPVAATILALLSVAAACGGTETAGGDGLTPDGPGVRFDSVDGVVAAFVASQALNGAAVTIVDRDEGIIHESFHGEFTPDRVVLLASSSKMVAADVLLALQDRGLIDLERPLTEFVEWAAGNPEITAAQLLSNSSGLRTEWSFSPYGCQWSPSGTLSDCGVEIMSTTADDDVVRTPDTAFDYGGGQWQVAGAVAETVSGRSWADLVEETLSEPCGLTSLGFTNPWAVLPNGAGSSYPPGFDGDISLLPTTLNPNIEGGGYANSRDYARLLLMHLRGGLCGDTRVLSESAIASAHEDRIARVYDGSAGASTGYGLGWWIDRNSGRRSDPGLYGSYPYLDLDDGYGVHILIEKQSWVGSALAEQLFELVDDEMRDVRAS
jgi:CubicO group peptidase (beta-lactamase class C family)